MELNINQNVSDAFYRYKMPPLSAKVEGKGNGIKTVIVNVTEIAKCLYRKPIYVTKYFGCELGAQIHVDDKNDRYIVNGSHDTGRLQELLFGFIKKFVLCSNCGNPETVLRVKVKQGIVTTTCAACGHRDQLDPRHRLTQFIIKNPPEDDAGVTGKKTKKNIKTSNGGRQNGGEKDRSPAGDDIPRNQSLSDDDEDVDWGEDTTLEAQERRLAELSSVARKLTISSNVERTEEERANIFLKSIKAHLKAGDAAKMGVELRNEAQNLELSSRAVLIVAETLLSSPKTLVADIKKYSPVLIQFTRLGDQQEKTQGYVLGAIASIIEKNQEELLPRTCEILHTLYDSDILVEDAIQKWFDKKVIKRYVKSAASEEILKASQPFLKWLKEADEETDEEEDNKDGDSTSEEGRNNAPSQKVQNSAKGAESESEEIDIDAI